MDSDYKKSSEVELVYWLKQFVDLLPKSLPDTTIIIDDGKPITIQTPHSLYVYFSLLSPSLSLIILLYQKQLSYGNTLSTADIIKKCRLWIQYQLRLAASKYTIESPQYQSLYNMSEVFQQKVEAKFNTYDKEKKDDLSIYSNWHLPKKSIKRSLSSEEQINDSPVSRENKYLIAMETIKKDTRFMEFLNPVSKEDHNYYQYIKTPMCINEIIVLFSPLNIIESQRKIKNNRYTSEETIRADIQLIASNCLTYNVTHLKEREVLLLRKNAWELIDTFESYFPHYSSEEKRNHKSIRDLHETIHDITDDNDRQMSEDFCCNVLTFPKYTSIVSNPINLEDITVYHILIQNYKAIEKSCL